VATALAVPDVRLHTSWSAALGEFRAAREFPHGSGLDPTAPPTLDEAGCAEFTAARLRYADPATVPAGKVPCTFFWVLEDDEVVGFLAVRHTLNDFLRRQGGHIGYSVRPSARRRGHASAALRLGLDHAAALGVHQVLLTVEPGNQASRRTIERAGGVLEDERADHLRYWVTAGGAAPAPR
jgi:predicted acetyltransferase